MMDLRNLRPPFAPAVASVAIAALASAGCSAVVSDIGGVQFNREACVQGGNTEVVRDAHFVFSEMQAHSLAPTFVALIGGRTNPAEPERNVLRGRALISPSFAAADYDPRVLTDMSRCAAAAPESLTMDFTIPAFLPPDSSNGGPFRIDFWSETGGRESGREPTDHGWLRPVCDDGDVFFVHNTGFDVPVEPEANGADLTVTVDAVGVALGFGLMRAAGEVLARVPFVLRVSVQDRTVGYMRVIYNCDDGPYVLPGILDVGSSHALELYFDVNLNGEYDPECDPRCAGAVMAAAGGTTVNFTSGTSNPGDFDVARSCSVPEGFDTASCRP
jgi:hypothetical protein